MANTNAPFGLRPFRHMSGGDCNRTNAYSIASEYGTSIYTGDVVELTGTGRNIAKSAAANMDNIGVFKGCQYVNSQGEQVFSHYWPASTAATDIIAHIVDDPNVSFECQADGAVVGEMQLLADWNVGTGSTTTGQSGLYAVVSGTSSTTGKALRVVGLIDRPGNAYGSYAKIEVMFATHVLGRVVSGVGGV
jgi:hypothetical protein